MTRHMKARAGFAIPMVILVMFILVGALAAGFAMLTGELAADDATIRSQGAAALELWFPEADAPTEIMRAAVDAALR